ncbi:MAG: hypothetical protein JST51_04565 [Armatimonadetes bacterium]|nr:hypothetical protein [Armatimonadota bacterium]
MMRLFAFLLGLLLAAGAAFANRAIVFISPSDAGPAVSPETVTHPLWVLWPAATDGSGVNQLAAIATKSSPSVSAENFRFSPDGPDRFVNRVSDSLARFGLPLDRNDDHLQVLSATNEGVDQGILAMGACLGQSVELAHLPDGKGVTYLAHVRSWNDVAELSRKLTDRTLVVEFPPPYNRRYSRLWIYERGKVLLDLPVGVIEAKNLTTLPPREVAQWPEVKNPGESMHSGAPDRWLAVGETEPYVRVGVYVLIWIASFVSLWFLSQEKSGTASRIPFYLVFSLFFAFEALHLVLPWTGIGLWWLWTPLLTAAWTGLLILADSKLGTEDQNIFVGIVAFSLIALSLFQSEGSPFSELYSQGRDFTVALESFQLFAASAILVTMRGRSGPAWTLSFLALPLIMVRAIAPSQFVLLVVGILCLTVIIGRAWSYVGGGLLTLTYFIGIGLAGGHPVWRTYVPVTSGPQPLNYFEIVHQLFKPEFGIAILALLFGIVFASRFGAHRLRKAWYDLPTIRPLVRILPATLVAAFLIPSAIAVLPWMVAFLYLFWTQEALRQLT